jgi:hypothetical protein
MSHALDGLRFSVHLPLKWSTPQDLARKARRLGKKREQLEKLYVAVFSSIEVSRSDRLWMVRVTFRKEFWENVKKWHLGVFSGVRYEQYRTWREALIDLNRQARIVSHYIEIEPAHD